jgi:hypothetical protein
VRSAGDFEDFDDFVISGERDDAIGIAGYHRGIGLHDHQPPARLKIVPRHIDRAFALTDVGELYDFAGDVMKAPEARILAAAKCEALFEHAALRRWERPRFNRERLKVLVNALDSKTWRSPTHYGTDLDPREGVRREEPLGEDE